MKGNKNENIYVTYNGYLLLRVNEHGLCKTCSINFIFEYHYRLQILKLKSIMDLLNYRGHNHTDTMPVRIRDVRGSTIV